MGQQRTITGRAVEIALLAVIALVVFQEGYRFVTTLGHEIGATEAGVFLIVLAALLAVLTLIYGMQPVSRKMSGSAESVAAEEEPGASLGGQRNVFVGIGLFFGFVLLLSYVDYAIATFIFLVTYLRFFGRYRWPVVVITAAAIAFGSAYLWDLLGVAMPRYDLPFGL